LLCSKGRIVEIATETRDEKKTRKKGKKKESRLGQAISEEQGE